LVNGTAEPLLHGLQQEYFVATATVINETNVFRRNGITDFAPYIETYGDTVAANDEPGYLVKATGGHIETLKRYGFVKRISSAIHPRSIKESYLFPVVDSLRWNIDQYGPLRVPGRGTTIVLTPLNVAI
jgi:signal peptidase I